MTDYTPVDCGLHSEYELAIMHRDRLTLSWRDTNGITRVEAVTPFDLRKRNREEFLAVRDANGAQQEIRLDRILGFSRG